ncbi:SGNH/GDSL hydrolase family protein [Paenibacillus rhizovicinus]|uniref:SGNH/GDSL hydrolase family protein n=1 Tax=Paenibacillus rhizovicinus TaxID=2704463 RepID=A0A6C0P049_9BACL|nr:SGNH/GDSL hydrolase family protein [Paenibacillus rhizovicinus]QHW31848.1 SGNH/GDSL hydrolase family protein [Paenibacillus rhizovicinus]
MLQLDARHIAMRGGLPRFASKLSGGEDVAIAYLGGSITEGAGASVQHETSWRALNGKELSARYAASRFAFLNAGVGGTTSTFGAHRLQAHVLSQGAFDLLFVEFAVNDGEDREESIRGMEGIVRQCRRLSPQTELVFLYTAADKNLSSEADRLPFNIAVHEEVAARYGIASVNIAGGVQDRIGAGETTWEALAPDRVHPNDEGHALYARYVSEFLERAYREAGPVLPLSEPPTPLDERNYEHAEMGDCDDAASVDGFLPQELGAEEPLMNWRFSTRHLAAEGSKGEQLAFAVKGRRAGIVLLHGPDSGDCEYSLDGGRSFTPVKAFDEWCLLAYRPILVAFPFRPEDAEQRVIVRCTGTKDERSKGTGIRVMKLLSS